MTTLDQLNQYLGELERRLRLGMLARGVAILVVAALAATLLLVLITNAFAFSSTSMTLARLALWLVLFASIALGIWIPFRRVNRLRAAARAEQTFPQFEERLLTAADQFAKTPRDPFLELLAADTMQVAKDA